MVRDHHLTDHETMPQAIDRGEPAFLQAVVRCNGRPSGASRQPAWSWLALVDLIKSWGGEHKAEERLLSAAGDWQRGSMSC